LFPAIAEDVQGISRISGTRDSCKCHFKAVHLDNWKIADALIGMKNTRIGLFF